MQIAPILLFAQLLTLFALLKIYWTVKAVVNPIFAAQENLMTMSYSLQAIVDDVPLAAHTVDSIKAYVARLRERAGGKTSADDELAEGDEQQRPKWFEKLRATVADARAARQANKAKAGEL